MQKGWRPSEREAISGFAPTSTSPVHEAAVLEVITVSPDLQLPAGETFPLVEGDLQETTKSRMIKGLSFCCYLMQLFLSRCQGAGSESPVMSLTNQRKSPFVSCSRVTGEGTHQRAKLDVEV